MEKDKLCSDLNDFTFSDNYIDDINNKIIKTSNMRNIILNEIFKHHQAKQKDTASFKKLFFDVFNKIANDFYDILSIDALDIIIERMYIKKEKDFVLDDNIKSVLDKCFYYYIHNFQQDWGDRTRYCKNDIKYFINKKTELHDLYIDSLRLR